MAVVLASLAGGAQAPPKQAAGEPKVTWYFYTVKWGFQDEFLDLFQRNHYPVLKAREKAGQFRSVRTYVPEFHGDGRADWTFAVELIAPPNPPATPTTDEIVGEALPRPRKVRTGRAAAFRAACGAHRYTAQSHRLRHAQAAAVAPSRA